MILKTLAIRGLVALFFAMFVFLLPRIASSQTASYRNISFAEFSRWLEAKDFVLINVHVPYQGEIPGTDLLLPYHSVVRQKDRLPASRDTKIVVYCLTGPMGYAAAQDLVQLGYTRVYHYEAGMRDWVRRDRELIYRSAR